MLILKQTVAVDVAAVAVDVAAVAVAAVAVDVAAVAVARTTFLWAYKVVQTFPPRHRNSAQPSAAKRT